MAEDGAHSLQVRSVVEHTSGCGAARVVEDEAVLRVQAVGDLGALGRPAQDVVDDGLRDRLGRAVAS